MRLRASKCIAWVITSRGTWWLCFVVDFACFSWWLPPPRWLGEARIVERRKVLVFGFNRGDCQGFLTFSQRRAKRYSSGLLVACGSSSCVGFAAPDYGLGVWCLVAHEPPSEWITIRTSLPSSKWTSVKNHCVIIWFWGDCSSLIFILVIDWFTAWLSSITILLTLFTIPQTSCQAL